MYKPLINIGTERYTQHAGWSHEVKTTTAIADRRKTFENRLKQKNTHQQLAAHVVVAADMLVGGGGTPAAPRGTLS